MSLTEEYLDLVNHQLPKAAETGAYPVRFNHCFARIILDNICERPWYETIAKPAYKNMTPQQLQAAIALGETFMADPQACHAANRNSLKYRNQRSQ